MYNYFMCVLRIASPIFNVAQSSFIFNVKLIFQRPTGSPELNRIEIFKNNNNIRVLAYKIVRT